MPESAIILSQAVTYVASAPKSNSAVNAITAAQQAVRQYNTTVPVHLRDAHYRARKIWDTALDTSMPTTIRDTT